MISVTYGTDEGEIFGQTAILAPKQFESKQFGGSLGNIESICLECGSHKLQVAARQAIRTRASFWA